jgi:hypothetical protein
MNVIKQKETLKIFTLLQYYILLLQIQVNTVDKEEQNTDDGKSEQRPLLNGSIDEIGKDLQEIKKVGVDHAIFNYNRSSINSINIDKIIDISKQFSTFLK